MPIVAALFWFGLVAAYVYRGLVPRRFGALWPVVVGSVAFASSLPWAFPRLVAVGLSVVMCAKSLDIVRGRVSDPKLLATLPTFLLWFVVPPDGYWPPDRVVAQRNRHAGRQRWDRLPWEVSCLLAVLVLPLVWPGIARHRWLETEREMWVVFLSLDVAANAVTGLAMQTGIRVDEVFAAPYRARSPRDFWSRRWNLYVHGVAQRHLFKRWGGRRHPLRATLAVFVASGLMHEYLIFAAVGRVPRHVGWMMTFFVLQGLAVVAEVTARRWKVPRLRPGVAIAVHHAWLLVSAPLFLAPLSEAITRAASG